MEVEEATGKKGTFRGLSVFSFVTEIQFHLHLHFFLIRIDKLNKNTEAEIAQKNDKLRTDRG